MNVAAQMTRPSTISGCRPTRSEIRPITRLGQNDVTACAEHEAHFTGVQSDREAVERKERHRAHHWQSSCCIGGTGDPTPSGSWPPQVPAHLGDHRARPFSRARAAATVQMQAEEDQNGNNPKIPAVTKAGRGNPAALGQPSTQKRAKKRAGLGAGRIGTYRGCAVLEVHRRQGLGTRWPSPGPRWTNRKGRQRIEI